jgi:alkaline phosphatase
MMHVLDYDRALGELLELDDTVKATVNKIKEMGHEKETLILVTADHGHGFDVMGSVDTTYLAAQNTDRKKRDAIGTYEQSGLSQYINTGNLTYTDSNFPSTWDPRYTLFQGLMADPDRRENWKVHKDGPRKPAVAVSDDKNAPKDFKANPKDAPDGILLNGTLPVANDQGVHSLTDVPVFAMGPCQELFGGVYNNIDIFFNIAACFGLARDKPTRG